MTPTKLAIILIIISLIVAFLAYSNLQRKSAAIIDTFSASIADNSARVVGDHNVGNSYVVAVLSDAASGVTTTPTLAVNPYKQEVDALIDYYAIYYKSEVAEIAKKIIHCESSYRHYDKSGNILLGQDNERGIAQFLRSTFNWYSSHYGWVDADIDDWKAQVRLLVIMLAENKGSHWSCYKQL